MTKFQFIENKAEVISYAFLTLILLFTNLMQCNLRIYGRKIFLALLSLQDKNIKSPELDAIWENMSNDAYTIEICFYIISIAFYIWIGYKLVTSKIHPVSTILWTLVIYLILFLIFFPLQRSYIEINNLILPIYVSFVLSLLQIAIALFLKRRRKKAGL